MTVYKTTRPIPPPPLWNPKLTTSVPGVYLRPLRPSDLSDLHELRTQPEVMKWTSKARVDADIDETKTWLERFIDLDYKKNEHVNDDDNDNYITHDSKPRPTTTNETSETTDKSTPQPEDTTTTAAAPTLRKPENLNLAIIYSEEKPNHEHRHCHYHHQDDQLNQKSKVIGVIGCHRLSPCVEIGYMIRQEHWGRGITTAAMRAYLDLWWSFEREIVDFDINDPTNNLALRGDHIQDLEDHSSSLMLEFGMNDEDDDDKVKSVTPAGSEKREVLLPELIKAEIEARNIASQRLLLRYGFVYESSYTMEEHGQEVTLLVYYLRRRMGSGLQNLN